MKRFLCSVLIVALLGAMCLPAALAEEADDAVEAEVAEALNVGEDTGLIVEGSEDEWSEDEPEEDAGSMPETDESIEAGDGTEPLAGEGELAVAAPAAAGIATGIHFSAEVVTIGAKEDYAGLTVVAEPAGAALPPITWRTANPKIARVDANGRLTGVKKGNTTVYAAMADGKEISCKVKVLKAPKKLVMKPKKLTLGANGATYQLTYKVPKGSASNSFTWTSSNKKVATVDQNGVVTTVGTGTATITVKAYNNKGGKCKLTVNAAPTAIEFPIPSLSLAVAGSYKPAPAVTFGKGKKSDPGITYSVSPKSRDSGCLTLDPATGEMTGVRKGSAIVVATTYNGLTATLPVTVAAAPAGISLSQKSAAIGVKDTFSGLLATLEKASGETACATTIVWTSSNKKVASVDANGVITGLKKGKCTITATTTNGKKASCKVVVYKQPKWVKLSPAKGHLNVGETGKYKVQRSKGSGGTLHFESSDTKVATVTDDGVVTAVGQGDVTITVITYNNKKFKAKLTVKGDNSDVQVPTGDVDSITSTTSEYDENMTNAEKLEYVIYKAQQQLGKPYIYGSGYRNVSDPKGFDCSGLVYWSFKQIGITMQDSAYRQGYKNTDKSGKIKIKKVTMSQLKRGDVVCFDTVADGDLCDHTGIYLGNGKFIHASTGSSYKVLISSLASGYYKKHFSWGRRVLS